VGISKQEVRRPGVRVLPVLAEGLFSAAGATIFAADGPAVTLTHAPDRASSKPLLLPRDGQRPGPSLVGNQGTSVRSDPLLTAFRDQIVDDLESCGQLNLVRIVFKTFPQRLSLPSQFPHRQDWRL